MSKCDLLCHIRLVQCVCMSSEWQGLVLESRWRGQVHTVFVDWCWCTLWWFACPPTWLAFQFKPPSFRPLFYQPRFIGSTLKSPLMWAFDILTVFVAHCFLTIFRFLFSLISNLGRYSRLWRWWAVMFCRLSSLFEWCLNLCLLSVTFHTYIYECTFFAIRCPTSYCTFSGISMLPVPVYKLGLMS